MSTVIEKKEKLGILKKYEDGYVLPVIRFKQIPRVALTTRAVLNKEAIGYIVVGDFFWVLYRENDNYFRMLFAKNILWWRALTNEPEYACIAALPQVYLI